MKNAAIDTNVLINAYRQGGTAQERELTRRARLLLAQLDEANSLVILPAIALAEFLTGIDKGSHGKVTAELEETFVVASFDPRAASIAAELFVQHKAKHKVPLVPKQVLKADAMIIASARAAGADIIYSDDGSFRRLATLCMRARDYPTHDEHLFSEKTTS